MSIISRRKFIKSLGLCTILTATGNIHEGLSFVPSYRNTTNPIPCQSSEPDACELLANTGKNLFIGVGEPGYRVGRALQSKTGKINTASRSSVSIQQFSPKNNEINGLITNADFIFLVGSIKDRDFWIARDLILSHNIFLLYTIIIDDSDPKLSANSFQVNDNEGCVFIPGKKYEHPAVLTVHSLFSMLMMPGMVCVDGSDIKSVISGQCGYMVHTISSYKNSLSAFKKTICICRAHIKTASCILLHIMYDEIIDYTLEDMTLISDAVDDCCSTDTELLWTCTEPLNLGSDFRTTLFIPFDS